MNKKPNEIFREHTQNWCQIASQVQPPLTEKENGTTFMSTLSSTYYDRLIGLGSSSFANLVKIGERIEDGLKIEKIKDYQRLFYQSSDSTCGSTKKNFTNSQNDKSEKEVHIISNSTSQCQQPFAALASIYHLSAPPPPSPFIAQCVLYPPYITSVPIHCERHQQERASDHQ